MNRRTVGALGALATGVTLALVAANAHASPLPEFPAAPGAHATGDPPGSTDDPQGIVGGKPAAEGAYPWMSHLAVQTAGGTFVCGGSLISPDIILTAAHCLEGATKVTASIGKVRFKDGVQRTGTKFKAGPGPEKGDWAVIRLDSEYKAPAFAALPADAGKDKEPKFMVMGWGATSEGGKTSETLMQVEVPLVPDSKCGPAARVEVCAGDLEKGGKDTCQGDSGGPLAVRSGSKWVLVGVTSWGKGCAKPNEPGHYAQLSALLGPVKAAIKELGGVAPAEEGDSPAGA
ncbi:trypsin [Pilimelia anulata]|uniref:Trypsin n=1 Tax=Pilimelia anulata TaxID=53371 RepID=A0A8J3BH63_9ACTN|nr:serine protease [Pilimelia anulata]GGK09269.1 trypsin [Pilimelia anulata]